MPWRLSLNGKVGQRAGFADVGVQGLDLLARDRIGDAALPVRGRRVVVGRGDDGRNAPGLAPRQLQAFEGLRAGDFMHQVAIDVEQGRAVVFDMDDMAVPEFFVKRF
jgi:hypothetical protein